MFPTYQCLQNGVQDFFLFCLDLGLFAKIRKDLVSTHSFFTTQDLNILITQDLNIKKNLEHPFVDIVK